MPFRTALPAAMAMMLMMPGCTSPGVQNSGFPSSSATAAATEPGVILRDEPIPGIRLPEDALLLQVHFAGPVVFVSYSIAPHVHHAVFDASSGKELELSDRIKGWEHIGDSWFRVTEDPGTEVLYHSGSSGLTRVRELPGDLFAVSATAHHVAVLEYTGTLTVYEASEDALTPSYSTSMKLARGEFTGPTMTWVTPHEILALTPIRAINKTVLFTKDLELIDTINGKIHTNNTGLAHGVLPLSNERGDRHELVALDASGRELGRTPIPGSVHYVSMPSPDQTRAILTTPGLLKGERHGIITVEVRGGVPVISTAPPLRGRPVGWRP